jgi:aminopeptidase N
LAGAVIDRVFFDLAARRADGLGMTVASVTEGGSALRYTHEGERLTILLGRPSKAGEVREYRIKYAGFPEDGMRFGASRQNQRVIFTWNWPTKMRDWAPTLDHPSSKVTSEFVVTAPEQYSVVSNGLLQSEVALGDGRKTTHWKQGVPIAVWLNALGIGRFETYYGGTARGVPLEVWAPTGSKVDVENGFAVARRAIDFFGDTVGPYPYEKLAQVVAPFDRSSTENASVIFYGDGGTRDGGALETPRGDAPAMTRVSLLAHEIAHQWFGNSVTEASWGDVWLSEGFATYFADLYIEHYEGRDALVASLKDERTGALAAERRERDPVITSADEADGPDLSRVQYAKGGWVLHMLRNQVTTPQFLKAIKTYYQRQQGQHAATADLRQAMEETSGQDLKWFFDQWLTRVDSPKLDAAWSYDAQAKAVRLTISQLQPGEAYRLPIEIGVADEPRGALQVHKLQMDRKNQEFSIPVAKPPVDLLLDPNTNLLADMTLARR